MTRCANNLNSTVMKSFSRYISAFKLQTWFLPGPQKSASGIQAIPHDNRIYVRDWSIIMGWLRTDLYYKWWVSTPDLVKEWEPEALEEFVRAGHESNRIGPDFWKEWVRMKHEVQMIYIDKFIQAHEPMIRKELDEHYAKYSEHRL